MSVGWTKEEYDRCPELATRLHRRILDLQDENHVLCVQRDEAQAVAGQLGEALGMARGFLGMPIRSPRSAAWVADQALAAWGRQR